MILPQTILQYIGWTDRLSMSIRNCFFTEKDQGEEAVVAAIGNLLVNPLDRMPLQYPVLLGDWTWEQWMAEDHLTLSGESTAILRAHEFALACLRIVGNRSVEEPSPLNQQWKENTNIDERRQTYEALIVLAQQTYKQEDGIAEVENLQLQVLELEQKGPEHQELIEAYFARIEQIYSSMEMIQAGALAWEAEQIAALQQSQQQVQTDLAAVTARREEIEIRAQEIKTEVARALEELSAAETDLEHRKAELTRQINDSEQQLEAELLRINQQRAQMTAQEVEAMQHLSIQQNELQQQIDATKAQREQLRIDLQAKQARVRQYEVHLAYLRAIADDDDGWCSVM